MLADSPLLCHLDRQKNLPESSSPFQKSWRDPHRRGLVGKPVTRPQGREHTKCATTAAKTANPLHSSFSKSSADLGIDGYQLYLFRPFYTGKTLQTVDRPPHQGKGAIKTDRKVFQASWLLIARMKSGNNGRYCFGSFYYLNQSCRKSHTTNTSQSWSLNSKIRLEFDYIKSLSLTEIFFQLICY